MPELRARILELAAERPRWGYHRIHLMLSREGWMVNRKRVLRLYREDGLLVRRKGKRRRSQAPRPIREPLGQPNQRWSIDFVHDALANGRRFRCLTVLDEFTRESLAIEVDYSLPSSRVIEVLERLREQRGLPQTIISDNGSEFASRAFDAWAYARSVQSSSSSPGSRSRIASSRASTARSATNASTPTGSEQSPRLASPSKPSETTTTLFDPTARWETSPRPRCGIVHAQKSIHKLRWSQARIGPRSGSNPVCQPMGGRLRPSSASSSHPSLPPPPNTDDPAPRPSRPARSAFRCPDQR